MMPRALFIDGVGHQRVVEVPQFDAMRSLPVTLRSPAMFKRFNGVRFDCPAWADFRLSGALDDGTPIYRWLRCR